MLVNLSQFRVCRCQIRESAGFLPETVKKQPKAVSYLTAFGLSLIISYLYIEELSA